MRALFLVQRLGWAFHNIADALAARAPAGTECEVYERHWVDNVPNCSWDVIVSLWWGEAEGARALLRARRFVVAVYDEGSWTDKIPAFERALRSADAVAVASPRLRDLIAPHVPAGTPVHLLQDGVDLQRFPPLPPPRRFTLGWCGNSDACRDADHKGLKIIRDACRLERVPLVVADLKGSNTTPIPHAAMSGDFYAQISAYACASLAEGTPNPPLEALASGRPVLTTPVGIMPQVVDEGRTGTFTRRTVPGVRAAIRRLRRLLAGANVAQRCRAAADRHSWDARAAAWWKMLGGLCAPRLLRVPDVTAVLVSSGEPTTTEALDRLYQQDEVPRVTMISNVAPMDLAFRMMGDAALTPYFVQVDADMVLDPGAISRLAQRMRGLPPNVAIHVDWLWGDLEEMSLQGVKIYRTAAIRAVPWRASVSCEVDQLKRLADAGYKLSTAPRPETRAGCVGVHVSAPDPASAFRRWRRLMMKRRAGAPVPWVDAYPERFRRRFLDLYAAEDYKRAAIYEAAWLGAVAGMHCAIDAGEADARAEVCHPLVRAWLDRSGA